MQQLLKRVSLLILFLCLSSNYAFAKQRFTFSTGATYLTGDYGISDQTEIYFVPFTFKYKYDKLNLKITLPYIQKTGPRQVIQDIGQFGQQVSTEITTESGLGDITAAVRYNFYTHRQYKILMNLEGKVKLGTASESKSLGTGKTDYSFRLGLYKIFGNITPYARVGFKVYGSPRLNDVFFASSGLSYKVNSSISAGTNFTWRDKVSKNGTDKLQLTTFSSQKLTKNWAIQEYIIKGFNRSTADWGGGISISYGFNI